jgi:DNA-binding protein HU-beta
VSDRAGVTRANARDMLDAMVEIVEAELAQHGRVRLFALGVLEAVERRARIGHDPRTLAKVQIAARRIVRFAPGKRLRDVVASRGK